MKKGILSIGNVFTGIRKGLEYIQKANKILQSLMLFQQHGTALVNDLELIWNKQPSKIEEQ